MKKESDLERQFNEMIVSAKKEIGEGYFNEMQTLIQGSYETYQRLLEIQQFEDLRQQSEISLID